MKISKLLTASAIALGGFAATAAGAEARQPYDPNVARVANPANVCTSIPGSLTFAASMNGLPAPDLSWFDFSSCVRTLAQGKAFVPGPGFGDPYKNCDVLVQFGVISYPATLHEEPGGFDLLLPDLIVKNRKECGNALYAFHTIEQHLPAGPA